MEQSDIPFQVAETIYYLAIFVTSFLGGVFQMLRAGNYRSVWHCINSGVVSGFLAFAIVSYVDGDAAHHLADSFNYMGIAAAIGLTIHWQEQYLVMLFNLVVNKAGLPSLKIDERKKKRSTDRTGGEDDRE